MSSVLTDDGVRIAYRDTGTGPLTVIFMHGWAGSGTYFQSVIDHLDLTSVRVITVDLRGHGESDKVHRGFTLDRFARDVFAVADHAGVHAFVVVGFSMSAKFAQYLSVLDPERVAGQILVAGCPAAEVPLPPETHRDWVLRAGNRRQLIEVVQMFTSVPVEPAVLERFANDAVRIPEFALDETLAMCTRTSFVDQIPKVVPPTLIVGGLHDPIFSPATLREGVAARLNGSRVVLLDCNHEIPIERPRELAALVEAFLAGVSGTERQRRP